MAASFEHDIIQSDFQSEINEIDAINDLWACEESDDDCFIHIESSKSPVIVSRSHRVAVLMMLT